MTPSSTPQPLPKEDDLSKVLTSVADLMLHSYRDQYKRLLTYLTESEHVQINGSENQIIIRGKTNILLDLLSDLIKHRKRLVSFNSHLDKFINLSKFPNSLIRNKHILKRLKEFRQI